MAQTGFTPIQLYYSTTPAAVPLAGNLLAGEFAWNAADTKLYAKNSAGTVVQVAPTGSTFAQTLLDDTDAATMRGTLGTDIYKTVPVGISFNTGDCYKITAGFTLATGFASGNVYTIYNNSAAAVTLTQGTGLTLRLAGTATTGNRTLAAYGLATVLCMSTTEYIISGAGIS